MIPGAIAVIIGLASISRGGADVLPCAPLPGPLIAATPQEATYVERFNALVARDPYLLKGHMAPDWRALLHDVEHDGSASPALIARTEMRLAASLQEDDQGSEALGIITHAIARSEAADLGKASLHAELMTELAMAEAAVGKAPDALRDATIAAAEAQTAFGVRSWPTARAQTVIVVGNAALGRYVEAEALAAWTERFAQECLPADDPRTFYRISTHAVTLAALGRLSEALAEDERAANWASLHARDQDDETVVALDNLGWRLANAGRLREAEALLRRALDVAKRYQPDDLRVRGELLGKFALVLYREGRLREAEAMWLAASDTDRQVNFRGNPLVGTGELRRSADAAQASGDLPTALSRRERAIALMSANVADKHPELARARLEYATTLLLSGQSKRARVVAEPAIAIVRAGAPADSPTRLTTETAYAAVVARTDGADAAYSIAAPVADRLERVLLDAETGRGDLLRLAPQFQPSFAIAARLALATRHADQGFRWLQLANFTDLVTVANEIAARAATANPAAHDAILTLQHQVQDRQQLDRERVRAVATHDVAGLAKSEDALRAADVAITASTARLDAVFPAYRRLSRPLPVPLDAFRATLGVGDLLVAPLSLADGTVTVAVTREGLSYAETPVPAYRIGALAERIRLAVRNAQAGSGAAFDVAAARDLASAVLPPALATIVQRHRHLLYYASGRLATVPPSLFVTAPARHGETPAWLVRSHSISVLPTLNRPKPAAGSKSESFLGVGAPLLSSAAPHPYDRGVDTDFVGTGSVSPSLSRLPNATRELRAMAASFPPGRSRLLVGAAATETAIKTLPPGTLGTIAIATHGLVRDALPGLTEPALVLTPPATPSAADDGLLTASEITTLHLDADWVILSACDTAGGSNPEDSSYTGLALAFMEAGARSLLVSHWAVRDDVARRLTVATLQATRRGVDRATALQGAMLTLMRDRSVPGAGNPVFWAPFVLIE